LPWLLPKHKNLKVELVGKPKARTRTQKAMKRYGNLWERITSLDNLMLAHQNARKGKTNRIEVQAVDENPVAYCTEIQSSLRSKTFTTSKYHIFTITDRGKTREICDLPYYPDRIVHWALMQILEPIFLKHFIPQTYAALPRRGTHKALRKMHQYMSNDADGTAYCLKMDVRKFFPNVNPEILKRLLRTKIKCANTLWLLDNIVDSYGNGLPIGNYTSQYLGNFYLSFLDHWLKEVKHIKYYLRYMDDVIILHGSKEYLHKLRAEIDEYLTTNLKLHIKDNWQIFPTYVRGVDFVGYRSFKGFTLVRKGTKKRLQLATRRLLAKNANGEELTQSDQSVVGSYNGILKWCDSYRLQETTIKKLRSLF
jgi:retron-type reverse transcriptase